MVLRRCHWLTRHNDVFAGYALQMCTLRHKNMRGLFASMMVCVYADESSGSWALSVTGWQRRCASAAVVLNEIMCGIGDTIEYDADNVNTRPAANTSKDVLPIAGVCIR